MPPAPRPTKADVFVDPEGKRYRFDRFLANTKDTVAIAKDAKGNEVTFIWRHRDGENTFFRRLPPEERDR